jgi:hypothetical protein
MASKHSKIDLTTLESFAQFIPIETKFRLFEKILLSAIMIIDELYIYKYAPTKAKPASQMVRSSFDNG